MSETKNSYWMGMGDNKRFITSLITGAIFLLTVSGIVLSDFPSHLQLWAKGETTIATVDQWEPVNDDKNPTRSQFFKLDLSFKDETGKEYSVIAPLALKGSYPPDKIRICYLKEMPWTFALSKDMFKALVVTIMSFFVQILLVIFIYIIFRKRVHKNNNDSAEADDLADIT